MRDRQWEIGDQVEVVNPGRLTHGMEGVIIALDQPLWGIKGHVVRVFGLGSLPIAVNPTCLHPYQEGPLPCFDDDDKNLLKKWSKRHGERDE